LTEKEFKQFFDKNFDSLRSYLYYRCGDKELATDIAQDTFVRIWEKQIPDEGKKTIGLAYKIAGDFFISKFRKEKSAEKYMESLKFNFTDDISPEEELEYKELKENYEHALAGLSEKQRVVFLMSRLEGLKYSEIADKLGISVKAVEKRMHGALNTFREILKVAFYMLYFSIYTSLHYLFNMALRFYNV
jgi:RNA polymerase sigma-70 factor (ECF subfamily)